MLSGSREHPIVSFVPQRFREARLEQLDLRIQMRIVDSPKDGLLLYGPTGRGKSFAMAAIANVTQQRGDPAARAWVDWAEFCRDVRSWWTFRSADDRRAFDPFAWARRQELLFVDDLGQEQDEKGAEFFASVVMDRYNDGRGICITTNLTPAELDERYGGRISSRLKEMCLFIELSESLPDYRLRAVS